MALELRSAKGIQLGKNYLNGYGYKMRAAKVNLANDSEEYFIQSLKIRDGWYIGRC